MLEFSDSLNRRPCPRTHRLCLALRELKIPLLLDSTHEREESSACWGSSEREGEGGRSPQRVAGGRGSDTYITAQPYHLSLEEALRTQCN